MRVFANLAEAPIFSPSVGNYYKGMIVFVPLHTESLAKRVTPEDVRAVLQARYARERYVRVMPLGGTESLEDGYLSPTALNGTNDVELFVFGRPEQILLAARLDNLGKGASGAAVQNLNLMLGLDEHAGLETVRGDGPHRALHPSSSGGGALALSPIKRTAGRGLSGTRKNPC
jgi:N-acetyl-gamma-glutamyl-phosphate reductase